MINTDKAAQNLAGHKVHLTGATGFISSDICEELLALCAKAFAPDNISERRDLLPNLCYGDHHPASTSQIRVATSIERGWRRSIDFHERGRRGSKPSRHRSRLIGPLFFLYSKNYMDATLPTNTMPTVKGQAYNMLRLTNRNDILIEYGPPTDGYMMSFDIDDLHASNDAWGKFNLDESKTLEQCIFGFTKDGLVH